MWFSYSTWTNQDPAFLVSAKIDGVQGSVAVSSNLAQANPSAGLCEEEAPKALAPSETCGYSEVPRASDAGLLRSSGHKAEKKGAELK